MKKLLIVYSVMLLSGINLFAQQPGTKIDYGLSNTLQTNEVNNNMDELKQKPGPSFLSTQQIDIKVGIGFSNAYETNEVNYYRNKLNHQSDPVFILTLRFKWRLVGNLHIAWEPGVIEKSGKISGIALGFDSQYNDLYGFLKYRLWNLENSILLNYDLCSIKNVKVNIYVGPGLSWNISDKEWSGSDIPKYPSFGYSDYPNVDFENPYLNNTGLYIATGINLEYRKFQIDLRYIKEYSDLGVTGIGTHKSNLFCFLIGYEL